MEDNPPLFQIGPDVQCITFTSIRKHRVYLSVVLILLVTLRAWFPRKVCRQQRAASDVAIEKGERVCLAPRERQLRAAERRSVVLVRVCRSCGARVNNRPKFVASVGLNCQGPTVSKTWPKAIDVCST
jgi:hypothetical protein